MDENTLLIAHTFCENHRPELEKDERCGCFYCLRIFQPSEIHRWIDSRGTALCPYCGIDAVLGESSGYPITEEFLSAMKRYWF